jgi:hypothetical protein
MNLTSVLILINIVTALIALVLALVRFVECVYELKKTPEIDTFAEMIQVVKNFFKVEKYGGQ